MEFNSNKNTKNEDTNSNSIACHYKALKNPIILQQPTINNLLIIIILGLEKYLFRFWIEML